MRGKEGVGGRECRVKRWWRRECYMYLHQHSWHSCSQTQRPQDAATTGHGSCHLEAGERGGGGEGGEGGGREGGEGEEGERQRKHQDVSE